MKRQGISWQRVWGMLQHKLQLIETKESEKPREDSFLPYTGLHDRAGEMTNVQKWMLARMYQELVGRGIGFDPRKPLKDILKLPDEELEEIAGATNAATREALAGLLALLKAEEEVNNEMA